MAINKVNQSFLQKLLLSACLVFFLLGFFCTGAGGYFVMKGIETVDWPKVPGTIDISRLKTERSGTGSSSSPVDVADLGYYFKVGSQQYRGKQRSTFEFRIGRNTERSKKILEQYPVGKHVTVSYDPKDPNRSVLEAGAQSGAWTTTGAGLGFLLLGFAAAIFAKRFGPEEFE